MGGGMGVTREMGRTGLSDDISINAIYNRIH